MSDQDYNNALSTLGCIYQREVKDVAEAIFSEEVQPAVNALDDYTEQYETEQAKEDELEQRLALLQADFDDLRTAYYNTPVTEESAELIDSLDAKIDALDEQILETQQHLDDISELDTAKDEATDELETAINEAMDAVHSYVDGHEYIIYSHYHAFILLCSNASPDSAFIDDECLKEDLTSLAFAHFYADVTDALNYIVGQC